ncbi:hypothetical protein Pan241w_44540 [Gimesia alba]|uniref:Uncharacterized protein n=1 Tax=Gimesia alba TaxID=2527973 RepID=A0A517RKD4_9PLAN|nr:prealbumin-like fold domain-containing protein [Gimesia alba]QDT44345.1 hypothetical protein Pan241w_44540 [Gimesia alba]
MAWPEISIDDFPPERDDEPSSLRQDIIDELSDHFACALNRELLKNPDEQTAKQRVLTQFGDPIKIARQLWLDAMKEKIMSQRIMTGISAVMAVCCLAVVGIAWMLFQESQSINQKMLAQMAAMADRPLPVATTKMDPQFLNQLEVMMQKQIAEANSSSEKMHPIYFQLVEEKQGGKPAAGFKGTLSKVDGKQKVFIVDAVSDESGKLDFGNLPWGTYNVNLSAPWNEEIFSLKITTIPGRAFTETIFCPTAVPRKVPVEFQVDWQGIPAGEEMFLVCDFRHFSISYGFNHRQYNLSSRRTIQNHTWSYRHNLTIPAERGVYLIDVKNYQATPCPLSEDVHFENLEFQDLVWKSTVEALQGEYMPPTIYLIRKSQLSKLSELNSIKTIGLISSDPNGMDLKTYAYPGMGMFVSPFEKFKVEPRLLKILEKKDSSAAKMIYAFQASRLISAYKATTEEPNVWKIIVPDVDPITQKSGSRRF